MCNTLWLWLKSHDHLGELREYRGTLADVCAHIEHQIIVADNRSVKCLL